MRGVAAGLAAALCVRAAAAEQAVVFDAGSTGTRVHVISFSPVPHAEMPAITRLATSKVEPGLSAFARAPDEAGASVEPLLRFAEQHVPLPERARTPLMLYGTAGMRLLLEPEQRRVYASVRRACAASGFAVARGSFVTLSGEDEGYFGLLALMWLRVAAAPPAGDAPAGILDLGGGSAQIAFPLLAAEAAAAAVGGEAGGRRSARAVRVSGGSVPVFSRSHLGFGNRAALRRAEALLLARAAGRPAAPGGGRPGGVPHPCFHRGYNYTAGRALFVGTARSDECAALVGCLFDCSGPACAPGPAAGPRGRPAPEAGRRRRLLPVPAACAHTPPFSRGARPPRGLRFFGLSAMFYIANHLALRSEALARTAAPSLAELRTAAEGLCALPWAAVRAAAPDPFTPARKLPQRCFDAHYMLALLVAGFGFEPDSRQITFAQRVGAGQPEWPYGAVVHHLLLSREAHALRGAWAGAAAALLLLLLLLLLWRRRSGAARRAGARWLGREAPCPYARALAADGGAGGKRRAGSRGAYRASWCKHSDTNSDASDGEEEAAPEGASLRGPAPACRAV